MKDIYIHSFETILPKHCLAQSEINDWILASHRRAEALKNNSEDHEKLINVLKRFALGSGHIEKRYFECHEVDEKWDEHEVYRLNQEQPNGASIEVRSLYFAQKVKHVFEKLYATKVPKHLVHVTCTGYVSPSPPQVFFSEKDTAPTITHAYHMGCYASIPSIRIAQGLTLSQKSDVDIVHTEMCSVHLQPAEQTPEQMVVQTLFADGHIKYTTSLTEKGLRIVGIKEKIIPSSLEDMTWIPSKSGMKMTLSREVPTKIRDYLPLFLKELCEESGINREEVLQNGIFAIHPGGPKIIESVQKKLELREEQVSFSHKVLFERGNMSSATLPHVWVEILKTKPPKGTKIISLAFGPGLTIFGAIFEVAE